MRSDPSGYADHSVSYAVFDLDAPGSLTLATFISALLTSTQANLGPGFDAGNVDVASLDTIYIPRVSTDQIAYVLDTMRSV